MKMLAMAFVAALLVVFPCLGDEASARAMNGTAHDQSNLTANAWSETHAAYYAGLSGLNAAQADLIAKWNQMSQLHRSMCNQWLNAAGGASDKLIAASSKKVNGEDCQLDGSDYLAQSDDALASGYWGTAESKAGTALELLQEAVTRYFEADNLIFAAESLIGQAEAVLSQY